MLHQISQTQADRDHLPPSEIQNISPYHNPGHVLAPPRQWLEGLLRSEFPWHFFRLRYKNLLRRRFREEPARFFSLLEASEHDHEMYLTCHCLAGHCHREIAAEFMETLRRQEPYQRHRAAQAAHRLPVAATNASMRLVSNG